ncbi:hypothetical protein ACQ2H7_002619 [Candidozyma auris]
MSRMNSMLAKARVLSARTKRLYSMGFWDEDKLLVNNDTVPSPVNSLIALNDLLESRLGIREDVLVVVAWSRKYKIEPERVVSSMRKILLHFRIINSVNLDELHVQMVKEVMMYLEYWLGQLCPVCKEGTSWVGKMC